MGDMQTVVTRVLDCKMLHFKTVEDILCLFEQKVTTKTVTYVYLYKINRLKHSYINNCLLKTFM